MFAGLNKTILTVLVVPLVVFSSVSAQNNGLPSQNQSAAFLSVLAEKGLECEHLKPWQSLAIRAQLNEEISQRGRDNLVDVRTESQRLASEFTCETPAMTVWIEAASKGFETEMLPPYLVAYRTLASMDSPPHVFTSTALRTDYDPAIKAIDAMLARLETSGAKPEGGGTWPDYIAKISTAVTGFADTLTNADAGGPDVDRAAAWIAQSAIIINAWLDDED